MSVIEKLYSSVSHNFRFDWDGSLIDDVQKIDLGTLKVGVTDIKSSTPQGLRSWTKMPGWQEPGQVTVTLYVTDRAKPLLDEFKSTTEGKLLDIQKTATVTILGSKGEDVAEIILTNCWASEITAPTLEAGSNNPATFQVKFVYEDIDVKIK